MDTAPAPNLFPLQRCKVLHLVRHAQGIHNVEHSGKSKKSPELFDAPLSALGWEQVDNLRKHVLQSHLLERIELVIVSPLLRTMQTAAGVFGGRNHEADESEPPVMIGNVKSDRAAISSLGCPPFIAHELCRERLGVNTCDKRRSISECKSLFPAIDFSQIESDEDMLWTTDVRESNEDLAARGMKFIHWLWSRKEKEIAIVTHSAFLFETLKEFGKDFHPSMKDEMCKFFTNCELRSLVLVDNGLMASNPATTNYPGKVPFGLDQPSDLANREPHSTEQT